MLDVGRVCVKIAGREAGSKCVVVDVLDENFVTVDGDVRRKKCNVSHLEPLSEKIELEKGADHDAVIEGLKGMGIVFKKKTFFRKPSVKKEKKETSRKPENRRS